MIMLVVPLRSPAKVWRDHYSMLLSASRPRHDARQKLNTNRIAMIRLQRTPRPPLDTAPWQLYSPALSGCLTSGLYFLPWLMWYVATNQSNWAGRPHKNFFITARWQQLICILTVTPLVPRTRLLSSHWLEQDHLYLFWLDRPAQT